MLRQFVSFRLQGEYLHIGVLSDESEDVTGNVCNGLLLQVAASLDFLVIGVAVLVVCCVLLGTVSDAGALEWKVTLIGC